MLFPSLLEVDAFDDDADDDVGDFIEKIALQLVDEIGGGKFISMMEDNLNQDIFGQNNVLGFGLRMSALDNSLFLGGLEDTIDNNKEKLAKTAHLT